MRNYELPCPTSDAEPPYQPEKWKENIEALRTHNCYSYMLNDLFKTARKGDKPQPGSWARRTKPSVSKIFNMVRRLDCHSVKKGVMLDNKHNIKLVSLDEGEKYKCKNNCYKGFMMIAPNRDYHFARQDNRMIQVYRDIECNVRYKKFPPKNDNQWVLLYLESARRVIPEIFKIVEEVVENKKLTKAKLLGYILKYSKLWSHKPGSTEVIDKDADGKYIINPMHANWDFSNKNGINYKYPCCFFEIPANYYKRTRSAGVSYSVFNRSVNNPRDTRGDLSVTRGEKWHERNVRNVIKRLKN